MKKRKRILSGILATAFLLALGGCGAGKPADTSGIEETAREATGAATATPIERLGTIGLHLQAGFFVEETHKSC